MSFVLLLCPLPSAGLSYPAFLCGLFLGPSGVSLPLFWGGEGEGHWLVISIIVICVPGGGGEYEYACVGAEAYCLLAIKMQHTHRRTHEM